MESLRITPSRVVFFTLGTLVAVGLLMYLRLAYEGADAKTAIRLVEEASPQGTTLAKRLEKFLPAEFRLCEAWVESRFRGEMGVSCRDARGSSDGLRWRVNILSGQVWPLNGAAVRIGKGESPW